MAAYETNQNDHTFATSGSLGDEIMPNENGMLKKTRFSQRKRVGAWPQDLTIGWFLYSCCVENINWLIDLRIFVRWRYCALRRVFARFCLCITLACRAQLYCCRRQRWCQIAGYCADSSYGIKKKFYHIFQFCRVELSSMRSKPIQNQQKVCQVETVVDKRGWWDVDRTDEKFATSKSEIFHYD